MRWGDDITLQDEAWHERQRELNDQSEEWMRWFLSNQTKLAMQARASDPTPEEQVQETEECLKILSKNMDQLLGRPGGIQLDTGMHQGRICVFCGNWVVHHDPAYLPEHTQDCFGVRLKKTLRMLGE